MKRHPIFVSAGALLASACVVQQPAPPPPEMAQVVSSLPVTVQQQVPVNQQVCDTPPPQGPNQTGGVVGALVGGALGGLVGNHRSMRAEGCLPPRTSIAPRRSSRPLSI